MRYGLAVVLFAAAVAVAAEDVSAQGEDFDAQFSEGIEARLDDRPTDAVEIFIRLAEDSPDNADVHLQLGFALLATDRLDEAQAAFERTLALAQEYPDANLGLGLIAFRRGSFQRAVELANVVLAAREDPEARNLLHRARKAQEPNRLWRVDVHGASSLLTEGFENWADGALRIGYQLAPLTTVSAGVEVLRRFGLSDHYFEGRLDHRFNEALSGYVLLGGTPEADFRPRIAYAAGGAAVIRRSSDFLAATSLTLDVAQAHYTENRVETFSPGLVQYVFGGRAWISARWINSFDRFNGHMTGYSIRGDWQATSDLLVYGGYADAPEPDRGQVIETRTWFAGGTVQVTDRLTLRAAFAQEKRSIGFDRRTFTVGFGLKF